jgi:hypothetical protein
MIGLLLSSINLGDVGKEIEDTAGITPLVVVPKMTKKSVYFFGMFQEQKMYMQNSSMKQQEQEIVETYHETSLTKFLLREIPALASKMEERLSPFMSVETTSSSV